MVRSVRQGGVIYWKKRNVFLSEVLDGERILLLPIDDRYYRVYFAAFPLARFASHTLQMERLRDEDRDEAETESGPKLSTMSPV